MGHILDLAGGAEPIVVETDGNAIGAIAMTCHGVITAGASTPDSLVGATPPSNNSLRHPLEDVCVL